MLKENLIKEISNQINLEFYSTYLYFAMSTYCDKIGYKGFAHWLYIQAQEEMAHGKNMYDYLLRNGAQPVFSDIKAPKLEYDGVMGVFKEVLIAEQHVTEKINKIATLAMNEGDHATYGYIQWFITEQIEEESSVALVIQKLELIGDNKGLIFSLDKEMELRTFVNPFLTKTY